MVNLKRLAKKLEKGINKTIDKTSKLITPTKKFLKTKISSKQVLKKQKASVTIKDYKAPSVLSDPNRFFKNELKEMASSL